MEWIAVIVGDMVFDPIAMTWRGNEEELAKFRSSIRPALIPQLNPATQPIGNSNENNSKLVGISFHAPLPSFLFLFC